MPEVKIIPPVSQHAERLRVAAYARVSSDSADQLNSFASQIAYYTDVIQSEEEWEFAGLYADEAVSGTTTSSRNDFQRLLEDCRNGKIDRILVKSISRFARNTLDCIQTVRELKSLCSYCGAVLRRRVNRGKVSWVCSRHLQGKELCPQQKVPEPELLEAWFRLCRKLSENRESILGEMLSQLEEIKWKNRRNKPGTEELEEKLAELIRQNHALSRLRSRGMLDSAIFIEKSNRNNLEIEHIRAELAKIAAPDRIAKTIRDTRKLLHALDSLSPASEELPIPREIIRAIVVKPDRFRFLLINGLQLEEARKE